MKILPVRFVPWYVTNDNVAFCCSLYIFFSVFFFKFRFGWVSLVRALAHYSITLIVFAYVIRTIKSNEADAHWQNISCANSQLHPIELNRVAHIFFRFKSRTLIITWPRLIAQLHFIDGFQLNWLSIIIFLIYQKKTERNELTRKEIRCKL